MAGAVIGTWDWHVQTSVVFPATNRSRNSTVWIPGNCGPEPPTGRSSNAFTPTTGSSCAEGRAKLSKQVAI